MTFQKGDVVLIPFPYTDLSATKTRPAAVVSSNIYHNFRSELLLAYISPSKLIFTIVGYVWAGVGGTFSIVILLTLFWKRFHGKAALVTIVTGMLFTIFWISTGLDARVITARVMTFFVAGIVAIISTYLFSKNS